MERKLCIVVEASEREATQLLSDAAQGVGTDRAKRLWHERYEGDPDTVTIDRQEYDRLLAAGSQTAAQGG